MTYGVQLVSALHVSDVGNALRSQRKVALKILRSTFVQNAYSAKNVFESCHSRNTIAWCMYKLKKMGVVGRSHIRVLCAGPRALDVLDAESTLRNSNEVA